MRISDWVSYVFSSDLVRGYNPRSIGIELVNAGRWPHWLDSRHQAMEEAYPDAQIDALVVLLHALQEELPSLRHIAGHDDLDTAMVPASDDPQILVPRKRSEEHTSELQSTMRNLYAVFCLKKNKKTRHQS